MFSSPTCLAWVLLICNGNLQVLPILVNSILFFSSRIWDNGSVVECTSCQDPLISTNDSIEKTQPWKYMGSKMQVTLAISHLTNYHVSTTWMFRAVNNPVSYHVKYTLRAYVWLSLACFTIWKMYLKIFTFSIEMTKS